MTEMVDERRIDENSDIATGRRTLRQKNGLENHIAFSRDLCSFDIKRQKYTLNKKPRYAVNWHSGCPMGFDASKGAVFCDWSDSHSLVFGATGSKKSRLIVMPTVYLLGVAGESMIISDPKAEIYNKTADFLRKNDYEIITINVRDPNCGNAWNPFHIPYQFYKAGEFDKAYEYASDIAYNLALSDISTKDPFWDYSAGDLLSGLILLLFKYCILNHLDDDFVNVNNLVRLRIKLFDCNGDSRHLWELADQDTVIASALNGTRTAPDRTKDSILCTLDEKIRFLTLSTSLMGMLSNNEIDIAQIRFSKTAVFLISPDEKTTFHKIIALFIKQSYEYLIYTSYVNEDKEGKFLRINYILDEFSALPTINDFPSMISAARSRSIRFLLVMQSLHQLESRYQEEAQTILANCTNWFFLSSRELKLLETISDLCGTDDKNVPLAPVYNLQRLNKDRGECLILRARLKPYLSQLLDIDDYEISFGRVQLPNRKRYELKEIVSFSPYAADNSSSVKSPVPTSGDSEKSNSPSEYYDIQKELERKFDELFGSSEEDGTDDN